MYYINLHYAISVFVFMYSYMLLSAISPENFQCFTNYAFWFTKYLNRLKNNSYDANKYYTGPIRVHYHYTDAFNKHPEQEFFKIKVLSVVERRIIKLIHARYGLKSGNLTLQPACEGNYNLNKNVLNCINSKCFFICGEMTMPKQFLKACYTGDQMTIGNGPGVADADYILVVDAMDSASYCTYGFGLSETCYLNEFDVPIGGVLRICNKMINSQINPIVLRDLVLHQFFHLLGMNKHLIPLARDRNGNARCDRTKDFLLEPRKTCYNKVLNWVEKFNYKNVVHYSQRYLLTGVALDVMKKYIKCDENPGLRFGEYSIHYLHLDELYYGTEIMTILPNPMLDKVTNITLNFLAYQSWFNIQLHEADPYDYLEFSNCQFWSKGIIAFIKSYNNTVKPPFCLKPFKPGKVFSCGSFIHFQYCDLAQTNQPNQDYQYFRELEGVKYPEALKWSGSRSYMEASPTLQTIYDVDMQSSFCHDVQSRVKKKNNNSIENYYGSDSLCFNHNLDNPKNDDYYGAACHKVAELNSSAFKIFFKSKEYVCPYKKTVRIPIDKSILIIECGIYKIGDRNNSITYPKTGITTQPQRKRSQMTQVTFSLIISISIIYFLSKKYI